MAKDDTYRQCDLHRADQRLTAWIPTRGARVGANVEVLDAPNKGMWIVAKAYETEMSSGALRAQQEKGRMSFPSIKVD